MDCKGDKHCIGTALIPDYSRNYDALNYPMLNADLGGNSDRPNRISFGGYCKKCIDDAMRRYQLYRSFFTWYIERNLQTSVQLSLVREGSIFCGFMPNGNGDESRSNQQFGPYQSSLFYDENDTPSSSNFGLSRSPSTAETLHQD